MTEKLNEIFIKRRQKYRAQNLKYLRYVFNDNFLLFLLIMLGALAVQYAQFVHYHSLDLPLRIVILLLVSLVCLLFGKVSSLLEPADSTFLIVKEERVKKYLGACRNRSLIFPSLLYLLVLFILFPLIKLEVWILLICFIGFVLIKSLLYQRTFKKFQVGGNLDWEALLHYEQNRQMGLLKIYSVFTSVNGLQVHARRRKYLDFLIPFLSKKKQTASDYLFLRSFLRTGDYFSITLRLLVLSILGIVFITNLWLALLFSLVMNYLLVFQLLPLVKSHDFHPLLRIYPIARQKEFQKTTQQLIFRLLSFVMVVEALALSTMALLQNTAFNLLFIFGEFLLFLFLFDFYIRSRLRRKIKQRK